MTNICKNCGETNDAEAKFCANCGELLIINIEGEKETTKRHKKLYRSRTEKIFSGLSAGLAQYFNLSTDLVRALWTVSFFLTSGTSLIWYIILAAVTPLEPFEEEGHVKHQQDSTIITGN